jgi:hypothetical protein
MHALPEQADNPLLTMCLPLGKLRMLQVDRQL